MEKREFAIVDVEHPEQPRLDQMYNADGKPHDVHQVKMPDQRQPVCLCC